MPKVTTTHNDRHCPAPVSPSRLYAAVLRGDITALSAMIAQGGHLPTHPETLLQTAVRSGNTLMVRYLVSEVGMDPDKQSVDGHTPIHMAIQRGGVDVVGILLAHSKDKGGVNTAIPYAVAAAKHGNLGAMYVLDGVGVDVVVVRAAAAAAKLSPRSNTDRLNMGRIGVLAYILRKMDVSRLPEFSPVLSVAATVVGTFEGDVLEPYKGCITCLLGLTRAYVDSGPALQVYCE